MDEKTKLGLVKKEKSNYYKKWRLLNKRKIKQYNKKYWESRVEKQLNTKEKSNS